ncbi:MAG: TRAP transporter TatT component family protein [Pseudomonadota bacterium]
MRPLYRSLKACALVVLLALGPGGCALSRLADNLPYGILNSDDPQLVREALPSYMVTVDGLLVTWPHDAALLRTAASLSGAYAALVATERERARKFGTRALDYALRAACEDNGDACRLRTLSFPEFEAVVKDANEGDLPLLFAVGSAWATYIQLYSDDWSAIAELARVQLIFERIIAIDPYFESGMPQLYLGVLNSLLSPSLGGRPEVARAYYEQAIAYSGGKNLYAKMMYAKQYARLLYDRELHDRLLNEVVAADPQEHGLTLANVYAQEEARRLLADADDYF